MDKTDFVPMKDAPVFFESNGVWLSEKEISARRRTGVINGKKIESELNFERQKGIAGLSIKKDLIIDYIKKIKSLICPLTYKDVKLVVEKYDAVMLKPSKNAMRGNRNFTGKIEDEIKGKLAELGFARYVEKKIGLTLKIDFDLITDPSRKRDNGDFVKCVVKGAEKDIPNDFKISLKSTAGNLLAVPEVETEWEGDWFVLVKLHINQRFLYYTIKAVFDLYKLDMNETIALLEIRGFVSKKDFVAGFKGKNLEGQFKMDNDFSRDNFIMVPKQLNQDPESLFNFLKAIKSKVENS